MQYRVGRFAREYDADSAGCICKSTSDTKRRHCLVDCGKGCAQKNKTQTNSEEQAWSERIQRIKGCTSDTYCLDIFTIMYLTVVSTSCCVNTMPASKHLK